VPGDKARVNGLITTGLQRLSTYVCPDGRFTFWGSGAPDSKLTAKVTHRLLGLRSLPFPVADEMVNKSASVLRGEGVKDNQLLALGESFRSQMLSACDAAAYYFHGTGKDKPEALDFLRRTAVRGDGLAHWSAGDAWGGALEATCDATRVLCKARDPLYRAGFAYVGARLINGRLYSTADTRALVELLAVMTAGGKHVRIDGVEQTLEQPATGRSVTALEDNVLVRVDSEQEINYLEPRAGFLFDVSVDKRNLILGERTQVHVRPRAAALAPLARIYFPPNLALLKGGANAQEAHLPVIGSELVIDAVAVRRGRGKLCVTVHDMYDSDKVGTAPGLEISVG
jgi:hypothetical protein